MALFTLSKQNLQVKYKIFSYLLFRSSFQPFYRQTGGKSGPRNEKPTSVISFILLGLRDDLQMQILIFIFLFITYMLSIIGNLIITTLILVDSHLKMVMCLFLQNLSFLEISFTSACISRFLYSV